MKNIKIEDIVKIKNEIKLLLNEINNKEQKIIDKVENNSNKIIIYKSFLENIIEEYHLICKKIYE